MSQVSYGDPKGYTAMAKTVGYPCAIATKMVRSPSQSVSSVKGLNIICFHLRTLYTPQVLDGEIQKKGAVLPFTKVTSHMNKIQ